MLIMNRHISLFKTIVSHSCIPKRTCKELPKGIVYEGFTYYPRDENFQDPPYVPSKLFFVKRIKSMKGRNPAERESLEKLNIDGKAKHNGHITVVKNIPPINALLWKVKHIVEIRPIIFKGELPRDGDYSGTFLRQTGEFIISPKLKVSEQEMKVSEEFVKTDKQLRRCDLRDYLKWKWLHGNLFD